MNIVSVNELCFDYGLRRALKNVSFNITRGSTTALVGPNGSGKTTLLRCITGLEQPVSGHIRVFDNDVFKNPRAARSRMGYISDSFGLFGRMTVYQCLIYMAKAYKLPENQQKPRVENIIDRLGLHPYVKTRANQLSRGWRQRVGIAMSIIHQPDLLLLDEPASGMDPDSRHSLSSLLRDLRNQGVTCIVSSHILAELEDYCTDMLVIKDGQVLDHVRLNTQARSEPTRTRILTLRLNGPIPESYIRIIQEQADVISTQISDARTVMIRFHGDETAQTRLLCALLESGMPVLDFYEYRETLQTQYIDLTRNHKVQP